MTKNNKLCGKQFIIKIEYNREIFTIWKGTDLQLYLSGKHVAGRRNSDIDLLIALPYSLPLLL